MYKFSEAAPMLFSQALHDFQHNYAKKHNLFI